MIGIPNLDEAQQLVTKLKDVWTAAYQLGEPSRMAGDQVTVIQLASVHREVATALRDAQNQGNAQVAAILNVWEGSASRAFTIHWSDLHARMGDLALRHEQMAGALDAVAGEASRFNASVVTELGFIDSWLEWAASAVVRMDSAEIGSLISEGRAHLSRWEALLAGIEQFIAGVGQRIAIDLAFSLSTVIPLPPWHERITVPEEPPWREGIPVLEEPPWKEGIPMPEKGPVIVYSHAHEGDLPQDPGEAPTGGRIYLPPKKGHGEPVPNPQGSGFVDANGNVWGWARDQHGGPHWDVQHKDGSHTNVAPDGTVIGKDNFPNDDSLVTETTT